MKSVKNIRGIRVHNERIYQTMPDKGPRLRSRLLCASYYNPRDQESRTLDKLPTRHRYSSWYLCDSAGT